MSGNKKLMTLLIASILLTACKTMTYIPDEYNFTVQESRSNPYGSWTILAINSKQNSLVPDTIAREPESQIAGELICMNADTIYILVSDRLVCPIYSGSVIKAQLFTHKNQTGTYQTMTGLFLIPNLVGSLIYMSEYGGEFLAIGIPIAAIGILHILIENLSQKNILLYPGKNSLDSLNHFARFPAGKPVNIDLKQLTLKTPFK